MHSAFEALALTQPDKTALVAGERQVSYGALARLAQGMADSLREAGIAPGDRVVVLLDGGIDYVAALYGVLALGAVAVPLGPQTRAAKLSHVLSDTGARALLTQATLANVWAGALPEQGTPPMVWCLGETPAPARPWPAPAHTFQGFDSPRSPDELAVLIYTSGTTGNPKGVMLTHANMLAAWRVAQSYLQFRDDDVIGLALPPSFSYGLYHIVMGLGLGATVVLENTAAFPVRLLQRLASQRVTVFPAVPMLWASLLAQDMAAHDLSALRLITNAGAALPPAHALMLQQRLPGARLLLMYGLTECMRASYLPHDELARRPDSVGRGLPFQEHWLQDEHGQRLPPGSTGELVVQGAHVSVGYWNAPAATAGRIGAGPDGTRILRTGDVFRSDEEGWLYCVGRVDDIFKSRGEKVSPQEVEHAICELPAVLEAAVTSMPDERLGLAVRAFVQLRPGAALSEREVIRHCQARLESWLVPRLVSFVTELPRTESGKLRRRDLA
ncbi:MAG: acyl--CoA ligase [Hydrogenophaga sp.]|nr:acyl--CoA ligase [Hydrogenophaga sp.]